MRNKAQMRAFSVLLVMLLLLQGSPLAAAQETVPVPTETIAATEESAPTEAPTEAPAETEAPTEPLPAEDESEQMTFHVKDKSDAIYQICDALAQNMEARQLFVYDTNTDTLLYTKNEGDSKLFPASITKLFSTYVALQYLDPEQIITVGDELDLVHDGSSLAWITKGSQLRVKTLVEGMMLPSGNDAAIILATAAGRAIMQDDGLDAQEAVDIFVDEMNSHARLLGFEKSHFSNPDGWHTGSHYTCINDLARISTLALENDTIRRYMRMAKDETTFVSGQTAVWENTNLLLHPDKGFYRTDAIGMKTGYTRPAGYSLMSAFTFEEGEIIIGQFGYVNKNNRFTDAIALVKAVKQQLRLEMASDESVG